MGMEDPQSRPSIKRARGDGTGDEKEEEAEVPEGPILGCFLDSPSVL